MAKLVPVRGGKWMIVSDDDYERVMRLQWHANERNNGTYCVETSITRFGISKHIDAHHFILGLPSNVLIDHIDGREYNNIRPNLRVATYRQNQQNKRHKFNAKNIYKGVYFDARYGRYYTEIVVDGKKIYLGAFDTAEEGAFAYDEAALRYFGEFAYFNLKPRKLMEEPTYHDKTQIILVKEGIALVDEDEWDGLYVNRWRLQNGYVVRGEGHKVIYMHRQILKMTDPNVFVDHINGKRHDNQKENLRAVTPLQNSWNQAMPFDNTSGYRGVWYDKRRDKWVAEIIFNWKKIYIGQYDLAEQAAYAWDAKAIELYGDFARTNFQGGR